MVTVGADSRELLIGSSGDARTGEAHRCTLGVVGGRGRYRPDPGAATELRPGRSTGPVGTLGRWKHRRAMSG